MFLSYHVCLVGRPLAPGAAHANNAPLALIPGGGVASSQLAECPQRLAAVAEECAARARLEKLLAH